MSTLPIRPLLAGPPSDARQLSGRVQQLTSALEGSANKVARALLARGVASGPLFYTLVVVQVLTRPGFDIRSERRKVGTVASFATLAAAIRRPPWR